MLALRSSHIDLELGDITEIMKSAVQKFSGGKDDVRNFLSVRYGVGEFARPDSIIQLRL